MCNSKSILAWICVDFKLPLHLQSWHWNMWTPLSREIARSFVKGQCEWLYTYTENGWKCDGSQPPGDSQTHSTWALHQTPGCNVATLLLSKCFRPAFRYPLRYLCCFYSAFHAAGWQYKGLILTLLMCFCLAWERFEPLVLAPLSGLPDGSGR